MKQILIIGAGRSSSSLISYLLQHSTAENWKVKVGDVSLEMAEQKVNRHANGKAFVFEMNDDVNRAKEIEQADIVISMLPAHLHSKVAVDCVRLKKNLVTASYVSKEINELDGEAKKSGIILLNEIGLDPGIDHMSAMQIIDKIKTKGDEVTLFKSYCGGLVAPEYNDNPWGYKFSWNPRNVVLAGQSTAKYIQNGEYKYIPYNRLFTQIETVSVNGLGDFDAYANRDSLSYRKPYGLENIPTLLRGTLRMKGYCKAWNAFVKLGLTDDSYQIENSEKLSYKELIESFLPFGNLSTKEKLKVFLGTDANSEVIDKLSWLGIFEDTKIGIANATPAQILQHLLEQKWILKPHDKDMIVMQHQFVAHNKSTNKSRKIISSLVVTGDDNIHTAMAKTVGLPMAIAARKILKGEINLAGVQIPVMKEIYEPVLQELQTLGIKFEEREE